MRRAIPARAPFQSPAATVPLWCADPAEPRQLRSAAQWRRTHRRLLRRGFSIEPGWPWHRTLGYSFQRESYTRVSDPSTVFLPQWRTCARRSWVFVNFLRRSYVSRAQPGHALAPANRMSAWKGGTIAMAINAKRPQSPPNQPADHPLRIG